MERIYSFGGNNFVKVMCNIFVSEWFFCDSLIQNRICVGDVRFNDKSSQESDFWNGSEDIECCVELYDCYDGDKQEQYFFLVQGLIFCWKLEVGDDELNVNYDFYKVLYGWISWFDMLVCGMIVCMRVMLFVCLGEVLFYCFEFMNFVVIGLRSILMMMVGICNGQV